MTLLEVQPCLHSNFNARKEKHKGKCQTTYGRHSWRGRVLLRVGCAVLRFTLWTTVCGLLWKRRKTYFTWGNLLQLGSSLWAGLLGAGSVVLTYHPGLRSWVQCCFLIFYIREEVQKLKCLIDRIDEVMVAQNKSPPTQVIYSESGGIGTEKAPAWSLFIFQSVKWNAPWLASLLQNSGRNVING